MATIPMKKIIPRGWDEQELPIDRLSILKKTIKERMEKNVPIPPKWINEYNDLVIQHLIEQGYVEE